MTGFELILSAALCLTCPLLNSTTLWPHQLSLLDAQGNLISKSSPPVMELEAAAAAAAAAEGAEEGDTEDQVEEIITEKRLKLNRLRDYVNGKHLVIATLQDYPLSYTIDVGNGLEGRGVAFELIDFLCEKFNFTYSVKVPPQNIIGSRNDFEGSLVEMLNASEVDMAAVFIPLLSEQRDFMYYSTTTLDEGEWIMVMQRPRESATGSGLMAPFDFWVWILIFLSLLAVGPIIYLLIILRNKLTGDGEQKSYSLGHCAWFVYGALMKQGSTLSPVADSTRLLFATWWIFITILTSFYTANLTAFLTLSKFTLPFNTVDDILLKNKHFVSTRGRGVEYAIRNVNESLSKLNGMIDSKRAVFQTSTNDSENLLNFVDRQGYVFVRDRPAINHVLYHDYRYRRTISITNEKIHCPFAMAKEPFLKKNRSFAYPLGSNLSELFDPELLNLVESGIIKHLSVKDLPNAEICPQDLGGTERQLRNGDLMMTYYIMLAGFSTSLVVFTTELLFRYLNSRQDGNKWASHGIGRSPNGQQTTSYPSLSNWGLRRHQHSGSDRQRLTSPQINVTPPPPYQSIFNGGAAGAGGGGGAGSSDRSPATLASLLPQWRRNHGGAANAAADGMGGVTGSYLGRGGGQDLGSGDDGGLAGGPVGRAAAAFRGLGANGRSNLEAVGIRRMINGRDYMVFRNADGQSQLVPVRAPSAALFQYTYND